MPSTSASFRLATPADNALESYDNTKLVAMGVCPTWGIVRYQMHKRVPTTGRAMALECGHAMHQVFAWVRLCSLWQQTRSEHGTLALNVHGARLYGLDRLRHINSDAGDPAADFIDFVKRGAIAVLDTSGYYDDERDKRRTLSNMEEAAFHYIDRWRWEHKVWMRDTCNPAGDVGIEWPFELVVDIDDLTFKLTGRIDGIHVRDGRVVLHENKTASRLNDAWEMSFATSSQVTGYCVAASVYTQAPVRSADIFGLSIPLPKTYDYGGYVRTTVSREDFHFERWVNWLAGTVKMYEQWENDPFSAPMFTHSCSRYFRPCSLIPFCDVDDTERKAMLDEMVDDEWNPLADKHEAADRD